MKNLYDVNEIKHELSKNGITLSKGLGQNFLIDATVCPKMAQFAQIDGFCGVIEIGPGVGVLTVELAKLAKKVVAIELDDRLKPILASNFSGYDNIELVWGDALKLDLHELIRERFDDCDRVCVCANLPYYISSPIIMALLEKELPIESVTVMVQREAAERFCAPVGSRAAGAVTVAVRYRSEPEMLFHVPAQSFLPAPKVDSAVMRLKLRKEPPCDVGDEAVFRKLVRAGFSQRRKTLVNSVSSGGFSKDLICTLLDNIGLERTIRIEQLTLDQLAQLCRGLVGQQ